MMSTFARTAKKKKHKTISSFSHELSFGYGLFTLEGHQDGG